LGEDFDPKAFDLDEINELLQEKMITVPIGFNNDRKLSDGINVIQFIVIFV
jgi:hypothetical protein